MASALAFAAGPNLALPDKTILVVISLALGMAAHGGAVARHRQVIDRRRLHIFGVNGSSSS
jgi:hypothetical protein